MMRKAAGLLEIVFMIIATAVVLYGIYVYFAGPKVLVYEGDAPHHIGWGGLTIERLRLEHDGYTVVKATSPEDLRNKVMAMHVTRILYEKAKGTRWVMFIDDESKQAVYYRGSAIFKGNKVYVPKPQLFGLVR